MLHVGYINQNLQSIIVQGRKNCNTPEIKNNNPRITTMTFRALYAEHMTAIILQ